MLHINFKCINTLKIWPLEPLPTFSESGFGPTLILYKFCLYLNRPVVPDRRHTPAYNHKFTCMESDFIKKSG